MGRRRTLRSNRRIVAVFVTSLVEPREATGGGAPLGNPAATDVRDEVAEEPAVEVARRDHSLGVKVSFTRGMGAAPRVLAEVARRSAC